MQCKLDSYRTSPVSSKRDLVPQLGPLNCAQAHLKGDCLVAQVQPDGRDAVWCLRCLAPQCGSFRCC